MDKPSRQASKYPVGSQGAVDGAVSQEPLDAPFDDKISNFFSSDVTLFERRLQELDGRLRSMGSKKMDIAKERVLLEGYCDEVILSGEKLLTSINDRKTVKQIKQRFRTMLHRWIERNPFIARGLQKPRGYPGDYMMMHLGYDNAVTEGALGLSSELDRICYKKYEAIARRKDKLKEILRDYLQGADKEHLKVLTLGGGPCREWLELEADTRGRDGWYKRRIELTYLDQDEEATEFSRNHLRNNQLLSAVEYRNESLISFIRSSTWEDRHGEYDFVYILGVGDYLGDSFLTNVIVQGLSLLRSSGKFVITQKDSSRFNFTFLDWFCDWSFVRRNEREFGCLLQKAIARSGGKFNYDNVREATGQIMFGIVTGL